MLPADIKAGHILRYSYLWHWQHLEGREEGDRDRPCLVLALVVTTMEDGTLVVRVLRTLIRHRRMPKTPWRFLTR